MDSVKGESNDVGIERIDEGIEKNEDTGEQNDRKSKDSVDNGKMLHDCVCEVKTWEGEQVMCCDKCDRWWHCSCAGLKGLDEDGAKLLVPWLGPCCFELSTTKKTNFF